MAHTKRRRLRNRHYAGQYTPSATGTAGWAGYGSAVLDGKPFFVPNVDIPRMMTDPAIQIGLRQLCSPLGKAKWEIKCQDQNAAKFIDETLGKFWTTMLPQIAYYYFAWGYAAFLPEFKKGDDKMWRLTGGRIVWPLDATPHVFKGGDKAGQFAGFEVNGVTDWDGDGNSVIECPYSFWFGGFEERGGRLYDHSRLRYAFAPWLAKETRGGILDNRQKYHRKWGVPCTVVYYPPGFLDPQDPDAPRNKDIAYEIAERIEAGNVVVMPDTRTPDDKSDPKWRVEVLESVKGNIDFTAELEFQDKLITKGLGVPPEVLEASETGSGYSGRAIPQDAFFGMMDQLIGLFIRQFDHCVLQHLMEENFGDDVEYDIDPIPLAKSIAQQDPNNPAGQGGDGNPMSAGPGPEVGQAGGGTPSIDGVAPKSPAAAAGGGGGDPTAGGLVPYLGKKGGRGKKNPKTGRVYYNLSHAGVQMGCLLAKVGGPLRDAVLAVGRSIPADHLADDGLEDDPHLTLRYGLHESDGDAVLDAVSKLGTLTVLPGELRCFEGPDHDVLYVSVVNASDPSRWYDALAGFPHTDTHSGYVPHVTVAYLKKGCGKEYVGRMMDPVPYCCPAVEYHGPDGVVKSAAVWPTADELLAMLSADSIPKA